RELILLDSDFSAACYTTTRIACCTGKKGDISILHLDKAAVTNTLATPRLQLSAVAFSSDGSRLAISSLAGHILIGTIDQTEGNALPPQFGLTSKQRLRTGALLCLDWHCAGECIATGGLDSFVHTFEPEKSLTVEVLRGHRGGVNCVQFLPNGHLLLSASSDRRVLLWDVRSGREVKRFESHEAPVMGATFFTDGYAFASCDSDGVVLKWDLRNGNQEVQLVGEMLYGHGRNCICYSPERNCLLTGNTDGSLTLINLANNKVRFVIIRSRILVKKNRH
ncbi:Transcription initiation factor TFIID subunit taf73, partial [Taenia solium]